MRTLVRFGILVTVAAVAGACSDSSSGPRVFFPAIGGSYTGNVTYQMIGDPLLTTPVVPGITIQMSDPDGNGNFSGQFAFNSGFTGTGGVLGQFLSDGVTTNWSQFGDAGQPLFFVGQFLSLNYPDCNFVGSGFTLDGGGGFDGNGNLTLSGTYSGIACAIDNAGDSVITNMDVSLASFNPFPQSRVAGGLARKSVLRGGTQHVR
jgi:hypothetical protein